MAILYNKPLSPQNYLELMTGRIFTLSNNKDQIDEIENILDNEFSEGTYWNYDFYDIDRVLKNGVNVVLVELCNGTDNGEPIYDYRWFEVADDWTRETLIKKMGEDKNEI